MTGQQQFAVPDYSSWQQCPDWLKELYDTSPPRWAPVPSGRPNLMDLYAFVALQLSNGRRPLRRWQLLAALLETEMYEDADTGLWLPVHTRTLTTVSRQLGKSWYEFVGLVVDLMTMNPTDQTMFMAQSGKAAREMIFDKWIPKVELSKLWEFLNVKTNKGITPNLWSERARTRALLHTGSEESGHGGTLRRLRGDEVWALDEADVETSTGAATRAVVDAQERYVSTVGVEDSDFMNGMIFAGRHELENGLDSTICLIEWSADEELDPGDEQAWWQATPCLNEISVDGEGVTMASLHRRYAKDTTPNKAYFRRADLNQIGKATVDTAINVLLYDASVVSAEVFGAPVGPVAVGIDSTLDGTMSSIALCDRERRVAITHHQRGRRWITEALNAARTDPDAPRIAVVAAKGSGMLDDVLNELEIGAQFTLRRFNMAEMAAACAEMRDRVHGIVIHDDSDEEIEGLRILESRWLRESVLNAAKPRDSSRFVFERGTRDAVLSPLYAAAFAVAAMTEQLAHPLPPKHRHGW